MEFALLRQPITCLAFNRSQTKAAGTFYDCSAIHVFCHSNDCSDAGAAGSLASGKPVAVLKQHDDCVSGLAWHPTRDSVLLSCGHDRAAYVWVQQAEHAKKLMKGEGEEGGGEVWLPQMVVVDTLIQRGLTNCAWSPSGDKLYLGSAAATIAVGRFDARERWWVCRALATHESTVAALAPHPHDNTLLASGGFDGLVILQSTLMKKVDGKESGAADFGTVYQRTNVGAWLHAMAWDSSGEHLAVAAHEPAIRVFSVHVAALAASSGGGPSPLPCCTVPLPSLLPVMGLAFRGSDGESIVAAGESYLPLLLTRAEGGDWRLSAAGLGRRMEKAAEETRHAEAIDDDAAGHLQQPLSTTRTKHERTIRSVSVAAHGNAFFTAGMDGKIVRWQDEHLTLL